MGGHPDQSDELVVEQEQVGFMRTISSGSAATGVGSRPTTGTHLA